MSQTVQNVGTRNVEESFKKFQDPEADDFKNVINSYSSTDASLVKFSGRFGL